MAWNEPGGNGDGKNHDPWNGDKRGGPKGGGDQGPPDLDEALRKLQDKLNSIFGKVNTGGGGGGGGASSSGSGFLWVLLVVVVLAWAGMGFYTVDQQERGVVLRLGKYYDTVNPGLQWNPPMIDDVTKVNVTRVRTLDHRALMLTEDENIVDIDVTVQYLIIDPKAYRLNVRDPEGSLANASESALRQVVGSSEMHSLLTEGREALGFAVLDRLQGYMQSYGTGLSISKINVKNAQAPSQVQDAFDDVIKAREDEQRVKNEAESYANGIVPEARGEAQRMLEEANAYREEVLARADGEAKRFIALLGEYRKAPEVMRERLYLDMMQSVLENNPKVLIDVEGGNNMMYLPLDKLMQNSNERRDSSRATRLDDQGLRELTDKVVDEMRVRQSTVTRREGR
ncbi:FtsH protease activity modulator HflK [Marinobacterium sedimentorum]|uniref:FtsH protease activity modulator HflK n=1 Tax=Marinobacterium sedimentorum TaxID=2927804 RepID=UPI0020C676E0|nr:FtsH protease activity modulator HflK [Marinobacterium sedimentorum]MCP8688139.1 FtsH protease activity modulator HflK [Marinobacterium sedimentorum]